MTTPKAALPELSNAANQYLTANMSFAIIDQMMNPVVVDKDLTSAPGSPTDGALYLMATAWSGVTLTAGSAAVYAGRLIFWRASANAWTVIRPWVGMRIAVLDEPDANGIARVYGCLTSLAAGAATWAVPESPLTNPMNTASDLIVGGASGVPTRLAKGSEGQVLSISGGNVAWVNRLVLTDDSTTSRTLALADANSMIRFSNAGAVTCTVPPQSSVSWVAGTQVHIRRAGAANLTITPGSGVSLNAPSGGSLVMGNAMTVTLLRTNTADVWDVIGQTVAS